MTIVPKVPADDISIAIYCNKYIRDGGLYNFNYKPQHMYCAV